MKKPLRWLGVIAIGAAMQAGLTGVALAQAALPAAPSAGIGGPTQEYGGNIGQSVVTSPTETEPGTELPVLYLTSVEIVRP